MFHNVLIVSNFFPPRAVGGAEVIAYRQALALKERGHQVYVLAGDLPTESTPSGSLALEYFDRLPVYRLTLHSLEPDANFYWPGAARRMLSIIKAHDIDTVHFHNLIGLGINLIPAAKRVGMKVIATLHDHWGFCYRQTRLRLDKTVCNNFEECSQCLASITSFEGAALPIRLRRDYVAWCLGKADRLITPSSYLAATYKRAGFTQPLHVSNGIDLVRLSGKLKSPDTDGVVRFLCTAYLGEHKGIMILLEAARYLAANKALEARWHLTMAGDGYLRQQVERFITDNDLANHISLPGRLPRHEVLKLLEDTQVVIVPSIWPENEPVSILEGLASGSAIIATDLGGSVELVENGLTGFLVPPGDALRLAHAMCKYITNPPLASGHGLHNLGRRHRLDESHTIDRLEAILSESKGHSISQDRSPVVICGTAPPPVEVAALLNNIHAFVKPGPSPRFVWGEWADIYVWQDAALVWVWDGTTDQSLTLHAIDRGIPVLAPASSWFRFLERHVGYQIFLYGTFLEAMAAIVVLTSRPELRAKLKAPSRDVLETAIALAHSSSFALRSDLQ